MPKFNAEALLFCLAWGVLAVAGFALSGVIAGGLLSVGLLLVIIPTSSLVLAKTGDLALERKTRWSILIAAGALFALVHALRG